MFTTKTLLKTTSFAALLATSLAGSPVVAADVFGRSSAKDSPVVNVAPALWDGIYVGVHGGWAQGAWEGTPEYDAGRGPIPGLFDPGEIDNDGWLAGVTVGANKQIGKIVLGIEADGSWGDISGDATFRTKAGGTDWDITQELDNLGTVRGRLGYAFGPVLLYGTGGVAFAQTSATEATYEVNNGVRGKHMADAKAEENHIGWTAGAGAEWALGRGWSLKAEWLHVDLGEADYRFKGTNYNNNGAHTTDAIPGDIEFDIFRAGVNYKIGHAIQNLE